MRFCLVLVALFLLSKPGLGDEQGPFCDLKVSQETKSIRDAFFGGDLEKTEILLKQADPTNPANRAIALGFKVFGIELIDPLSLAIHTHDFHGGELGAFIPNGREDPIQVMRRLADQILTEFPDSAPHVADALCLATALQLSVSIRRNSYITIDDELLFTTRQTSAKRELFETLACEVLCSNPDARKGQRELIRAMFLQRLRRESAPFLIGGLWIGVKNLAAEIDDQSRKRWQNIFIQLANECTEKKRYSSGCLITIYGAHEGHKGAWQYLHAASKELRNKPDDYGCTNLKIAFGYLGGSLIALGKQLPEADDAIYQELKENLHRLGKDSETLIALEAADAK